MWLSLMQTQCRSCWRSCGNNPPMNNFICAAFRLWMPTVFAITVFTITFFADSAFAAAESAQIVEVRKIWDQAPHNAFTDLIRFEGNWFCVFREGRAHVSPDGALRIITSKDGKTWSSAALLKHAQADLRDAKI